MLRLRAILYALSFILPAQINAQHQNYTFQHITTKDGLAPGLTKFIFQDSKGFYWLGYDNGFQKFDGKNFTTIPFNNKYILTSNLQGPILNPVEDSEGRVFVMNQGAIFVYEPGGRVDTIRLSNKVNDRFSSIESFCKDDEDNFWFVTGNGIYQYDKDNRKCRFWKSIEPRKITGSLTTILYDAAKRSFWLTRDSSIYLINILSKNMSQPFFTLTPGKNDLPLNLAFTGFWMDGSRNLWIGSWNGAIYKYNTINYQKKKYDEFNLAKNKNQTAKGIPIRFLEDKQKHIWIGCEDGGLYSYVPQKDHMEAIPYNNNQPLALHYNMRISALYEDREGNIWIGTDRGLNICDPSVQSFTTVDENSPLTLFHKIEVTRIFETNEGNILVGTWGYGWFMYDKNFRLVKHFYNPVVVKAGKDALKENLVWCFAEDRDKNIWIGYQHGLLGVFDPATGHIKYLKVPEFENKTIRTMKFDDWGNVWFGLHSGNLVKRDVFQHTFSIYEHPLQFKSSPEPINDFVITRKNIVWIATQGNGVYAFDPITEKITEHFFDEIDNSIFDNNVNSLTLMNDSVIAISTIFKGLILFNRNTKKGVSYTMQNGLPTNLIRGAAKDRQGNIWIATDNGLCRMNKIGGSVATYEEDDGLLLKKFSGNIEELKNGMMIIPAETGFVYFDPDKIRGKSVPPDVQITGFTLFDRPLSIDSLLSKSNTIELDYDQNFFTIEYASLSFKERSSTRYFYKLEGVDKNWIKAGTGRSTEYTDLNPGNYILKIKCENRDGISSKNVSQILILIHPPWWTTWWAYSFYALALGSVVYILYRGRIRKLRLQQATQIRIMIATQEEERKRISRDLHDDVGTKLSALKLFLSSLSEKAAKAHEEEIQLLALNSEKYITETMKDIRQLLLNLSPAVLEEFGYTTAVEGLVNKINETKQIRFNLVFFGMKHRLKKDYELSLYRITQELINNVLKHAEAKNVALQIGLRDAKIILMIEDDGKGFEVNDHKDGYGLHNLRARTNMLEGTMTIDSHPAKGTTVLIEIPYAELLN